MLIIYVLSRDKFLALSQINAEPMNIWLIFRDFFLFYVNITKRACISQIIIIFIKNVCNIYSNEKNETCKIIQLKITKHILLHIYMNVL